MNSGSGKSNLNLNAASANGVYFFSAMLPSLTDPQRIITFGPALFARLEKVQIRRQELESADTDRTLLSKVQAEEQMLQQALDWIRNCDLESNP